LPRADRAALLALLALAGLQVRELATSAPQELHGLRRAAILVA
jgi:hypothetical protein